jgi:ABC-2 type transport system permease protein
MGKLAGPELVRGLLLQAFWVIVTFGLARLAWSRGIRKYAAVGG